MSFSHIPTPLHHTIFSITYSMPHQVRILTKVIAQLRIKISV